MAPDAPLHGIRVLECSALGPAAITMPLVDLGAEVIKVEPPAGDYIREMTWPIVEGVSLMHLHVNRGKRSIVMDLRQPEDVATFKELAKVSDVVVEAMRPGGLARRGVGYEDLRLLNPRLVFCTISGYGMTGPYRDLPSHGIAFDTWAGIVSPAVDSEGFAYLPEHASMGIHAGPLFGALGDRIRGAAGGADRCRVLLGDRSVRRGRRHGLVPVRDLACVRASFVGSDGEQGRRVRAARTGHRRHGRGRPLPGLRDFGFALRPVHGLRAGLLEELLRGGRPDGHVRALARVEVRRPCTWEHRDAPRAPRHLPRSVCRRVDLVRDHRGRADRAGQLAEDDRRGSSVPRTVRVDSGGASRCGRAAHPAQVRG